MLQACKLGMKTVSSSESLHWLTRTCMSVQGDNLWNASLFLSSETLLIKTWSKSAQIAQGYFKQKANMAEYC